MTGVLDGGGGADMLGKRSLEEVGAPAGGCEGPDVLKRSMIELMLDCWGRDVGGGDEVLPPRMSARRSVLF
jgi:hypothetical protein